MAGRPPREEQVAVMTLRIPHPLLERVNRCKALVELQEGANLSRTEVLWRIIEDGCRVLEGQLPVPVGTPEVISGISVPPDAPETSGRPLEGQHGSQVGATARTHPRTSRRPLPAHIIRIAEERAEFQYSRLSLNEFAQHLFDTGIYRATAKDGTEQPVNRGTLQKWLKRAQTEGML
jgi:hypothetical protein